MPLRTSGVALFFSVAVGIVGLIGGCQKTVEPRTALLEARSALSAREYRRAEELAASIPQDSSLWAAARLVAGEAATRQDAPERALKYYLSVEEGKGSPTEKSEARFYAAEMTRELGRLAQAVELYRQVLADRPDNLATHQRLAFTLSATGQKWESTRHYLFLVRNGEATLEELSLYADLDRAMEQRDYLMTCLKLAPNDAFVELGLAVDDTAEGHTESAMRRLAPLLKRIPENLSAQARYGWLLLSKAPDQFIAWHDELPAAASQHPEIWYIRGEWARRRGDLPVAAGCFRKTLAIEPRHRQATYQLSQILAVREHPAAEAFQTRAQQLIELTQLLDQVLRTEGRHEPPLRQTVELLEQTGRIWEACAWGLVTQERFPQADWIDQLFARHADRLNEQLPVVADQEALLGLVDATEFPEWQTSLVFRRSDTDPATLSQDASTSTIEFVSTDVGLDFTYYPGPDPETAGVRMFEQTGGAVGVIDLDLDRVPDLYFTQGAIWKHDAEQPTPDAAYQDRLYRNRGGRLTDVTSQTGLDNRRFGQGVAVGDVDSDGFPDLYVANVGGNQLFLNQGDGTFLEVTATSALDQTAWTSSCAMADLNSDGHPDLIDINYLQGDGVYSLVCQEQACSPSVFQGAADAIWLNQGDGSFLHGTLSAQAADAKGLGVVVAQVPGATELSLFVANDQRPNFLYQAEPSLDSAAGFAMTDRAFLTGLAYDRDGLSLACMGIAAGDANADGRLDFFVTNFKDESNTLYLQDATGLFADQSGPANLRAASIPYVGWGTQFLDAELDGDPDLVLVNGHVHDYRNTGGQYRMRAQLFRNDGGRFTELSEDDGGEFFRREYLGRGLARLDWNQDGRMDFCVSNIDEPARLVENRTTHCGHHLNVRLTARRTARDAIGASVEVQAGEFTRTAQLTAGDGYMASNERLLQFGLGQHDRVTRVTVTWPSGATTRIEQLAADATLEIVEGHPFATLLTPVGLESIDASHATVP